MSCWCCCIADCLISLFFVWFFDENILYCWGFAIAEDVVENLLLKSCTSNQKLKFSSQKFDLKNSLNNDLNAGSSKICFNLPVLDSLWWAEATFTAASLVRWLLKSCCNCPAPFDCCLLKLLSLCLELEDLSKLSSEALSEPISQRADLLPSAVIPYTHLWLALNSHSYNIFDELLKLIISKTFKN